MDEKKTETLTIRLTPSQKALLVRPTKADKISPAQLAAIVIERFLTSPNRGGFRFCANSDS
ncbi:hypothetical protein [Rhodomicrobium lacus]|uniref:hypothetical protein n=1 Tax=Rhodomicrobium lacus TaxID=2498452 RepID=UPI000F8F6896|nr:hypothetical protein [Rhodomicrobium lacus]